MNREQLEKLSSDELMNIYQNLLDENDKSRNELSDLGEIRPNASNEEFDEIKKQIEERDNLIEVVGSIIAEKYNSNDDNSVHTDFNSFFEDEPVIEEKKDEIDSYKEQLEKLSPDELMNVYQNLLDENDKSRNELSDLGETRPNASNEEFDEIKKQIEERDNLIEVVGSIIAEKYNSNNNEQPVNEPTNETQNNPVSEEIDENEYYFRVHGQNGMEENEEPTVEQVNEQPINEPIVETPVEVNEPTVELPTNSVSEEIDENEYYFRAHGQNGMEENEEPTVEQVNEQPINEPIVETTVEFNEPTVELPTNSVSEEIDENEYYFRAHGQNGMEENEEPTVEQVNEQPINEPIVETTVEFNEPTVELPTNSVSEEIDENEYYFRAHGQNGMEENEEPTVVTPNNLASEETLYDNDKSVSVLKDEKKENIDILNVDTQKIEREMAELMGISFDEFNRRKEEFNKMNPNLNYVSNIYIHSIDYQMDDWEKEKFEELRSKYLSLKNTQKDIVVNNSSSKDNTIFNPNVEKQEDEKQEIAAASVEPKQNNVSYIRKPFEDIDLYDDEFIRMVNENPLLATSKVKPSIEKLRMYKDEQLEKMAKANPNLKELVDIVLAERNKKVVNENKTVIEEKNIVTTDKFFKNIDLYDDEFIRMVNENPLLATSKVKPSIERLKIYKDIQLVKMAKANPNLKELVDKILAERNKKNVEEPSAVSQERSTIVSEEQKIKPIFHDEEHFKKGYEWMTVENAKNTGNYIENISSVKSKKQNKFKIKSIFRINMPKNIKLFLDDIKNIPILNGNEENFELKGMNI